MPFMTVRMIFAGLIAFIPNSPMRPDSALAYLLYDPDNKHIPRLGFFGDCPKVDLCAEDRGVCWCGLEGVGKEITFDPPITGEINQLPRRSAGDSLPRSESEAANLKWLVDMNSIGRGARVKPWERVEQWVVAKFRFGWRSAKVCELAAYDDNTRVREYQFIGENGTKSITHALAEMISFETVLPFQPLSFTIYRRSGDPVTIRVPCRAEDISGVQCTLLISNEAYDPCDPGTVGTHFNKYYQLSRDALVEKFVPYLTNNENNYQPDHCGLPEFLIDTAGGRPICPMVVMTE